MIYNFRTNIEPVETITNFQPFSVGEFVPKKLDLQSKLEVIYKYCKILY
jgi:hypothetical protein